MIIPMWLHWILETFKKESEIATGYSELFCPLWVWADLLVVAQKGLSTCGLLHHGVYRDRKRSHEEFERRETA